MSTQVYSPQVVLPQNALSQNVFDFSFVDSHIPTSDALAGLPNTFTLSDISNIELDEQFLNMCSNITVEEAQHMIDSISASLAALPQSQSASTETPYFQQGTAAQVYEPTTSALPQPPMIVPSQALVTTQSAAPTPEQPRTAASGSDAPRKIKLLKAIALLKLNLRFNPLFQQAGLVCCPDNIDLGAGMEREDAMIAAGHLPQTHIPWGQALKLLGKQGFRTYYYSEMKKAKANNAQLPPVPEWITRYCFGKGSGHKPAVPSKKAPVENPLKNKQVVAKVLLTRNNPTRRSKAAVAISHTNKGKGKAVDSQRYNPYTRQ